jgi:Ca2+/H+ antiporter, TMEM165/GDT1 family
MATVPITIHLMEWKVFGTAFLTLFLAELGDKTQLAVITMSAKAESKLAVFAGASLALILVTLLGVLFGSLLTEFVPVEWLQRIVAVAFIVIGVLMLFGKL